MTGIRERTGTGRERRKEFVRVKEQLHQLSQNAQTTSQGITSASQAHAGKGHTAG
jgi:phage anti-repressor protein